jgi:hypothetical protein
MAERRNRAAIAVPTMMSGQGDANKATAPAASNTPTLEITSLREHSNVLDMFTSCARNPQSRRRQARFALSAMTPKSSISVDEGGTPDCSFTAMSTNTARAKQNEDTCRHCRACFPAVASGQGIDTRSIDQGVPKHIDGIGHERRRPGDNTSGELGDEHDRVDRQDGLKDPPLIGPESEPFKLLAL